MIKGEVVMKTPLKSLIFKVTIRGGGGNNKSRNPNDDDCYHWKWRTVGGEGVLCSDNGYF